MWINGKQRKRLEYSSKAVNEELLALDGVLNEDDSKIWLYKFLRNNIGYTAHLFLGLKLFPIQEMMIKAMMIADTCMLVLSRGGSKTWSSAVFLILQMLFRQGITIGVLSNGFRQCLKGDTLIPTSKGLKELKDIEKGDLVLSRYGVNKVLNHWKNPLSKSIKVTTKKSYSIEGKPDHRVLKWVESSASYKWADIKDLKSGDYVVIKRTNGLFGDQSINDNDAYLYGLLLGDGSFSGGRQPSLTSIDKETISFCRENYDAHVIKRENRGGCSSITFRVGSNLNYDYLCKNTATKKFIPKEVKKLNEASLSNFLQGLFDSDGCCSKGEISFCSSSIQLAKEVHTLLLSFGIVSKLCSEKGRGLIEICGVSCFARDSYKVRITGVENTKLFQDKIGFGLSYKKENLDKLVSNGGEGDGNIIPNLMGVVRARNEKGKYTNNLVKKSALGVNPKFDTLKWYVDNAKKEVEFLTEIYEENFFYDKVVLIEDSYCETYDIEVEKEHCYVGNGFVNHNSKMILGKVEDILNKPSCKMIKGLFNLQKGTDQWTLTCGRSKAIALPLADGSKLRGFRFQIMLIDEFLNMPKNIFTEVLLPFLGVIDNPTERQDMKEIEDTLIAAGKMTEDDRYKWIDNKLILLSSPSFTFEYMYELYCLYRDQILGNEIKHKEDELVDLDDDAYRVIFQFSYDCMPEALYDKKQLNYARATMSEATFTREYGGQFISESDSYFRLSKMAACTIPEGGDPHIEIAGDPKSDYIISIDPSWSEDEGSDDFAMEVFKLNNSEQKPCLVHAYGMAGTGLKKHIYYFYYLITHFNTVAVVMDYAGGVQFLSACNESELFKNAGIQLSNIEVQDEFEKQETYNDDILKFKSEYAPSQKKYVFLRKPTGQWIRQANELLQANIDHKRILFASQPINHDYENQKKKKIPIKEIEWDRKLKKPPTEAAQMVEFIDHQISMIELTKAQTANIEVVSNPQGSQTFRLPPHMTRVKGPNKPRKDNYSALVLGNWMAKVYFDVMNASDKPKVASTFTPFYV